MTNLDEVLAVILGGGQGKRLYPLTAERAKPAVPIAGKYRLIDIPISNCINSGIYKISVLTQFLSVSLHRHITRTYNFDNFHGGWVQVWAAEQTIENTDWYQGTADAVRKQILEIRSSRAKYIVILAGDHLYRMDYSKMVDFHVANNADITVAVQPVLKEDAFRFGILKRDEDGRITDFAEKPKDPELLSRLVSRDDPESPYLGSMGIYIFNVDLLTDVLRPDYTDHKFDDFGGDTDNQSKSPVRGSWQGIEANINNTDANLEIINLRIRYAVIGLKLFNLVDLFFNSLEISDSQLFPISCDALSVFPFENEAIIFLNNGQEVFSCPTPDQE